MRENAGGRLPATTYAKNAAPRLAGRGRLVIPEGFREFLGVEPGGDLWLIGAAICVEIWSPTAWLSHLEQHMSEFPKLFDQLSS